MLHNIDVVVALEMAKHLEACLLEMALVDLNTAFLGLAFDFVEDGGVRPISGERLLLLLLNVLQMSFFKVGL